MSKIGRTPISIPNNVTIEVEKTKVVIKGPKGQLEAPLFEGLDVKVEENEIKVNRSKDNRQLRSYHGLVRSLIQNHVFGVSEGYSKTLKLVGTGYRVKKMGKGLSLTVGFSHSVEVDAVENIVLEIDGDDTIKVSGIDKQKVGQVAANIRAIRPPEPYKGKGVRYEDEIVKLKPGKAAVE